MIHAKVLDCTLRDGAYVVDKKFGEGTIQGILAGLVSTGIDVIEIGFLQDEGFGAGKPVYKNSVDAEAILPENRGNSTFAAFCDYSRYSIENLDEYTGKSFDAVRACFQKDERYDVIAFCEKVKQKGYKLFVQPVDVMSYTDKELLELIELINPIEPYCFSIVDTFGSMYESDLQRVFSLIHYNLVESSHVGFHSHNNLQMSSALSQSFLSMAYGCREVVVDSTVSGLGRGAGNTPTELIVEYMVRKLGCRYDIDALLDLMDTYIEPIRTRASWGYDTQMFVAGSYSAHVNNIAYLKEKGSICSKDIRYILNTVGQESRRHYDYSLLESTYMNYVGADIDDAAVCRQLEQELKGRSVLVMAPGRSAQQELETIQHYIEVHKPIVIAINFIPENIRPDYIYTNNVRRFSVKKKNIFSSHTKLIVTSNVSDTAIEKLDSYVVSFRKLIKAGWERMDNSSILLLRLLDRLKVSEIAIAGLDGYRTDCMDENYAKESLEIHISNTQARAINAEMADMLKDFMESKTAVKSVGFITPSRFEGIV